VQAALQAALSVLLRHPIEVTGAGRTDAGVHAIHYIAHFDAIRDDLETDLQFTSKINGILPRDIAVKRVFRVQSNANARFDAVSRTYFYKIATEKNPFTYELAYHFYRSLNLEKMNEAASFILEYDDFTSFAKLHGNTKTNICKVEHAYWIDNQNGEIQFVITANRFLRNMVRAVVGTLLQVGLEKEDATYIHEVIQKKNRNFAGASVPPQGLYLANIIYNEKKIFISN
jgi:tRNA pseudouridine38-40 synthase